MNEWKVVLYRDSNRRRDELKDYSPFRHMLAECEPVLASGLGFVASDVNHFIMEALGLRDRNHTSQWAKVL